jgi:hypothetical protein
MSDQPTVKNRPAPESPTATPTPSPDPKVAEWNKQIHAAISLSALAMFGCFFLPRLNVFLGQTASGYELQQLPSDEAKLIWAIPARGLLALLAAVANVKHGIEVTSQLAGALPFLALIYYGVKIGQDLLPILQIGAYLTLILGVALFVLPRFLKKPQP